VVKIIEFSSGFYRLRGIKKIDKTQGFMIARIWQGETNVDLMEAYTDFLERTAVEDYRSVTGNQGLVFFRRLNGEKAEFTLISYWESLDAVKNFAGEDYEKAKYYPEDKKFLLSFAPRVVHYEVFFQQTNKIL
jgi:heme-degrading monooxygenase HmoA